MEEWRFMICCLLLDGLRGLSYIVLRENTHTKLLITLNRPEPIEVTRSVLLLFIYQNWL